MRTLLVVSNNQYFYIFCPYCKDIPYNSYDGSIEYDDYVNSNCLFWCNNCREILICPTCNDDVLFNIITDHLKENDCSKKISYEIANDMFPNFFDILKKENENENDVILNNVNDNNYYLVSILDIHSLTNDSYEEGEQNIPINYKEIGILVNRFCDIPNNISHDHEGISLYYKASCPDCGSKYESYIWGD